MGHWVIPCYRARPQPFKTGGSAVTDDRPGSKVGNATAGGRLFNPADALWVTTSPAVPGRTWKRNCRPG